MPNNDYVKREDIFPAVVEIAKEIVFGNQDDDKVVDIINSIPAADVEPVRHGRWIEQDSWGDTYYTCSICGGDFVTLDGESPEENEIHFCPMCGAHMDAEPPKEEENAEVH